MKSIITFETALLLDGKDIYIDVDSKYSYVREDDSNEESGLNYVAGELLQFDSRDDNNDYDIVFHNHLCEEGVIAYTQSEVQEYLRYKHDIVITVEVALASSIQGFLYCAKVYQLGYETVKFHDFPNLGFKSYEEALETALFNVIQNKISQNGKKQD